ncbi:hypothetical protein [Pseudomonas putida]|uniref:hypothetical protein n=1 Tax=Pseudomonas putida TaxID=303 RepID=UPI0002D89242|nr:hypothetical protein [Pseudomonas putida]
MKATISEIRAGEQRALKTLSFTAVCKNTQATYKYDFSGRPRFEHMREITGVFVWALYRIRNLMGHTTRTTLREAFWIFLSFLDEYKIVSPRRLNGEVLVKFAKWLKEKPSISYATAGAKYRSFSTVFKEMACHPDIPDDFILVKNAFPKGSRLQMPDVGYSKTELQSVMKAAVAEMRVTLGKLEKDYKPQWLGRPAPLEDVAPKGPSGVASYWNSHEYKVWWWENNCACMQLNSAALRHIPQGQVFVASFKAEGLERMAGVNDFYRRVGAGPQYQPMYLGKESPIKYLTPWRKTDYLVWYWENKLGCEVLSLVEMKARSPDMFYAVKEYFGGRISQFYEMIGLCRWISSYDLAPFYIMLLVRTQLNPSTILRLTVDCLRQDPVDSSRKLISYTKYRSMKEDLTIPSKSLAGEWPVRLVQQVINVTQGFRLEGQSELWITNANCHKKSIALTLGSMKRVMQKFVLKNDLRADDGSPLQLQGRQFRPSMAWEAYMRTEDLNFLKAILGHSKVSVTADYLRRVGDPIFKLRRAVKAEAMITDLLDVREIGLENPEQAEEALLNHCKNPKQSPLVGHKEGEYCTAQHEVCLGCANLIITASDVKKYFCFVAYNEEMLRREIITQDEFSAAVDEKKFIWETQVLTRLDAGAVAAIRMDALDNPLAVWSI